jgi:hypothetical protein
MYTKLNIGREQCTAETYCALNALFIIVAISIRAAMVTWMVVRQTFSEARILCCDPHDVPHRFVGIRPTER